MFNTEHIGEDIVIIIVVTMFFLLISFFTKKSKKPKIDPLADYGRLPFTKSAPLNEYEEQLLTSINIHRGIPLKPYHIATQLARYHSLYMLKKKKTSHEYAGARAVYLHLHGYINAKEICNRNVSIEGAFNKFLTSEPHEQAMSDLTQTHVGVGVIKERNTYSCTVIFMKNPLAS